MPSEQECDAILDRFAQKLARLRAAWDREPKRFETDFAVGPPLTEADLQQVEVQYRLTLPLEYRAFRLRFGDTATGPGVAFSRLREGMKSNSHEPFPLDHPLMGELSPEHQKLPKDQRPADYSRLGREWDAVPKDHGVILVSDYGCAIYAFLIVNGPYCGRVWMQQGDTSFYGPYDCFDVLDGADEVWPLVYPLKDYSFFEWYEHWLDLQLKQITPA